MRSGSLVAVAILAVLISSAAMPASAEVNLLENPGFETGSFPPWDWDIDVGDDEDADAWVTNTRSHSGAYSVGMDVDGWDAWVWIWQEITPQCAKYLEFWYNYTIIEDAEDYGLDVHIIYSDAQQGHLDLPYSNEWRLAHIDLNTTKLVKEVVIELEIDQDEWGYVQIYVDDFDLEACVAPPAVGGVVTPANTFALLSPWLMALGLVGCIGTAVVVVRKRRT